MVIAAVMMLASGLVQAQTFDEWFRQKKTQIKYLVEQIAALKAYGAISNKGYGIAKIGLTGISTSKDGDYRQHRHYITSLRKVKPGIRNYSKVVSIYEMKSLIQKYRRFVESYPTGLLRGKEKNYIAGVFNGLVEGCKDLTTELEMVINDEWLQLKDDERISRIDKVYFEMQDRYEFCRSFTGQVKILVGNRLKNKNDRMRLSSLYGIN